MVIHCYILNTFWNYNVFSQSVPSGPIEPPKFNQGFKSLNKDISRTVSRILKNRPYSRFQIQFSTTFILCKFIIFLLLRVLKTVFVMILSSTVSRILKFDHTPDKFNSLQHIFMQVCRIFTVDGLKLQKRFFWQSSDRSA